MAKNIAAQLTELQERIDEASTEVNEQTGARKELLKRLKTAHGCSDAKEAKKRLKELEKEYDDLSAKIDEEWEALQEDLPDED